MLYFNESAFIKIYLRGTKQQKRENVSFIQFTASYPVIEKTQNYQNFHRQETITSNTGTTSCSMIKTEPPKIFPGRRLYHSHSHYIMLYDKNSNIFQKFSTDRKLYRPTITTSYLMIETSKFQKIPKSPKIHKHLWDK